MHKNTEYSGSSIFALATTQQISLSPFRLVARETHCHAARGRDVDWRIVSRATMPQLVARQRAVCRVSQAAARVTKSKNQINFVMLSQATKRRTHVTKIRYCRIQRKEIVYNRLIKLSLYAHEYYAFHLSSIFLCSNLP